MSGLDVRVYLRTARTGLQPHGVPIPPHTSADDGCRSGDISVFLDGGQLAARSTREILQKNEIEMGDLRTILDFGCGCGRVRRFWKDLGGTELYGTDYKRRTRCVVCAEPAIGSDRDQRSRSSHKLSGGQVQPDLCALSLYTPTGDRPDGMPERVPQGFCSPEVFSCSVCTARTTFLAEPRELRRKAHLHIPFCCSP